ncbi:MAG: polysaccharide deacetylase family protein [Planctomycetota bacterium]
MSPTLRNLVKRTVQRVLHAVTWPLPAAGPRVLIYHSVDDIDSPISVSSELFRQQMDYLVRRGFRTVSAGQFVEALHRGEPLSPKTVVITFDDGYLNNIERALPILEERGLCATVFMVTKNDGDLPRWGERDLPRIRRMVDEVYRGSDAEKEDAFQRTMATLTERIATWDELAPAPSRGLEILSHTRTHPYMDEVDDDQLADELRGSRQDLAERGFGESPALAWPYGAHDDRTIAAATQAGYRGTFLAEPSWRRRKHPDPMRLARCSIDPDAGVFGLAFQLGRGYDVWAWLRSLRGGD